MTTRVKIELTASDIAEIIAEKYGVLASSVEVGTEDRFEGYGPTERIVHVAVAEVSMAADYIGKVVQKTQSKATQTDEGVIFADWYERLEKLEFIYNPQHDGPWYKADDVWACIDPIRREA